MSTNVDPLSYGPDAAAVNNYVVGLSCSSPLPKDKPLWEIHILAVHNAAVFRVHHALGDGISLMAMLLSSCRRRWTSARRARVREGEGAWRGRWSVWTAANVVWFSVMYVLQFAMRVVWMRDKATAVSGGYGVEMWLRRLATARFRLTT